jgi:hypothetical protein
MTVAISNKINDPLGFFDSSQSGEVIRYTEVQAHSVTSQHPCVIIRTALLNAELLVSLQKNFTAVAKVDNNSSNPPGHRRPCILTYAYRPAQYTDKLSLCFTVLEFSPFYVPIETCQSFISTPLSAYSWSNSRQIFGLTAVDFPIVVFSAEKVRATSKRDHPPYSLRLLPPSPPPSPPMPILHSNPSAPSPCLPACSPSPTTRRKRVDSLP